MEQSKVRFGGWLLVFFIIQILYAISMLFNFPDSLRNLVQSQGVVTAACILSLITLIAYCAICIVSLINLVLKNSSFLRNFQIAGIIAVFGNFIVYVIREVVYYQNAGSYYEFRFSITGPDANYYWALFVLALFWTLFWSVYFVKSGRTLSYLGGREYIDKAVFLSKTQSPEEYVERPAQPQAQYQQYPPQGLR